MHFTAPTILAFAASVSAYSATGRTFAVNHFYGKGPLMMGRVDPIVSPGGPSGHVHAVQGGNAFGITMTDTQALDQSTCTSSLVKNDKSNYWTPALWFQDPVTKELEPVDMFYMNVYYLYVNHFGRSTHANQSQLRGYHRQDHCFPTWSPHGGGQP